LGIVAGNHMRRLQMQDSRDCFAVGWSCMLQMLLAAIATVVLGWPECASAQAYWAVPETMQIEDQPGYVPDPEVERLPAIYQRQVVFYRTTESPGTIIVQTSERFLYVVQPNNRAIRYGIGVGDWSDLTS